MTFPKLALCAQIKPESQYPNELKTIGDHIRKRRLDLNLDRNATSKLLGVTPNVITDWEFNHHETEFRYYPAIIQFLGYIPFEIGSSRKDQLIAYRKIRGITKGQLAKEWKVEKGSVQRWEEGKIPRRFVHRELLEGIADRLIGELGLEVGPEVTHIS